MSALEGISDVCIKYRDGHVLIMYTWSSHVYVVFTQNKILLSLY